MVKIYVDAGHGGSDPGAIGNGLKEKDLTLKIAKKIQQYLGEYQGTTVKMSRTGDAYPTLTQRTNEANSWGADLFLSIHINAGGGKGYEDFVYTTIADNSETGKIRSYIHTEVMKKNGLSNRGKKKKNLHVLRETAMPAVLTENGFIDNDSDADKMKSQAWIKDVARGHVKGIVKAFNLKKKSGGGSGSGGSKPKPGKTNLPNAVYKAVKPYPHGSGVRAVQDALASIYFYPDKGAKNNGVDGYYGPKTADAVSRFQSVYLPYEVDGVYGQNTKKALEKAVK